MVDVKDPRNTRNARFRMKLSRDEGEKTIEVVVPRQDIRVRRHGSFEIGPKVEPWKGATVRVAGYPGAWHVEAVELESPDESPGEIAGQVAQETVDAAFAGRFIAGSKTPTTERHVTRDQLFRIVHEAVVTAVRRAQR